MTKERLTSVSFAPRNGRFIALMPMEELLSSEHDPEPVLQEAAILYERCITRMRSLFAEIQGFRIARKHTPARTIWQLGDSVFELREGLARLSLQLDGFYDHLVRDIGAKRKWLEKVIILRRYLPDQDMVPESLNWGRCEKGTRRVAERLRAGVLPDKGV